MLTKNHILKTRIQSLISLSHLRTLAMAPDSRIILVRHAQAEHNVFYDYSIHDAPLTFLGKEQATTLSHRMSALQQDIDLILTSPLRRTLQTTRIAFAPAIARLGSGSVLCLPELQECKDLACDTGSSRAALEADPEFADFNLDRLTPDWNSKKGVWAPTEKALDERARKFRLFLRGRPEKTIVVVTHGGFIARITASRRGPNGRPWGNAEVCCFAFEETTGNGDGDKDACYLRQTENIAVAGGYGPTGGEILNANI
ncbi:histidine phosphatase superfamily [Astrocystis sublimbata]|nr:histidine phosphatase superfamily [Astrocystis sublimbata]